DLRNGVPMGSNYAGVDWASEKHDVLIADETGQELLAATFVHDEAGLRSLCRALVRHDVQLVAVERPDGLLVERLLDAGLRVLARFWPAPIGLFSELDSQISLAFLEHYPSPVEARTLGEKRMAAFLARHRYSGNQAPAKLVAKLRSAPQGRAGAAEIQVRKRL